MLLGFQPNGSRGHSIASAWTRCRAVVAIQHAIILVAQGMEAAVPRS